MSVISRTSTGSVHPINQDYVKVDEERKIFLLADGIGSCRESHKASKAAVETAYSSLRLYGFKRLDARAIYEAFRVAVLMANTQVLRMIDESKAISPKAIDELIGGCTLDIGVVVNDFFYFAHVGDGRIYKHEAAGLRQLTQDRDREKDGIALFDSWVGCSERELRVMNMQAGKTSLQKGDSILMCTDGLYKDVAHEMLESIMGRSYYSPFVKLSLLHETARRCGSVDDCSGILYTHE
jgi:protein phosphatase